MKLNKELEKRSNSTCELCGATNDLTTFEVPPTSTASLENSLLACTTCVEQIENPDKVEPNHWRCLNDSMWSQVPAVQVMAWRMLNRLRSEGWTFDLLDMFYLDEETLTWAKATGEGPIDENAIQHLDSNGTLLKAGDTVVLIKTLNVKGSSVTAKRGVAVRRISLVHDNPEQIEGRVDGQQIVILTKYVKKSN
ncbi:MAG: PhnA domain-containing protein [Chitinophagales bacterium]